MTTPGLMFAMVVAAVVVGDVAIVLVALVAWYSRLGSDTQERVLSYLLLAGLLAPLWGTAIVAFLPSWLTRRLLYVMAAACVAAFVFAMIHSADPHPVSSASALVCVETWLLGLGCGIVYLTSRFRKSLDRSGTDVDPPEQA
jgi:hypothetical protein